MLFNIALIVSEQQRSFNIFKLIFEYQRSLALNSISILGNAIADLFVRFFRLGAVISRTSLETAIAAFLARLAPHVVTYSAWKDYKGMKSRNILYK